MEDQCAIIRKIKYKKSLRQQNISYFGSPKKANREGQEGKKREEEGEAKKKGMNSSKDFYDFDFEYGIMCILDYGRDFYEFQT